MPDDGKFNEAQFKQQFRLLKIKVPSLPDDKLLLIRMSGTESLSLPFEYRLVMLSTDECVTMTTLLRQPATVTIALADDKERCINGVFSSFRAGGRGFDDMAVYEATLVPKVWLLGLHKDCRIYHNSSVKRIVEDVFGRLGISDQEWNLTGTYKDREYCVQYRENTLNFVSRLLEEEGIFYYFKHEASKHTIVFRDRSAAVDPVPDLPIVAYSFSVAGWKDDRDGVKTIERIEEVHPGIVTLNDYNFTTPKSDLQSVQTGQGDEKIYDYPGEYPDRGEADRYSRIRLEEREMPGLVIRGTSRCRSFSPGFRFKLEDHFRDDVNIEYVITEVTHEASDTTYRAGGEQAHHYANTFLALPKSVPYRPPFRSRRPIIHGAQTAVVVGPDGKAGDDIQVDKYGRVKVQFFWDHDTKYSCWVRVSQIWAGKNWGWITIPRIGQEVVVEFLEGDPDRPLIVGRVYNADQMPPYDLPGNQTQSGIKTRSSKGGGSDDFNEIRFEDLKDKEMITVHAQKDMETVVEHDDTQTIQRNRTITVDGTHTETIKKDTTITITEGNHSTTLNQGNQTVDVDMGSITVTAKKSITLQVGSTSIELTPTSITMNSSQVTVNGQTFIKINGGMVYINC